MRVKQFRWLKSDSWVPNLELNEPNQPDLALVFFSPSAVLTPGLIEQLRNSLSGAVVIGCSTAGEIHGTDVTDDSCVVTALWFDNTTLRLSHEVITHSSQSLQIGQHLTKALLAPDLRHVLVISDGHRVNGSQLVSGIRSELPPGVTVTGGLAGDGSRFGETTIIIGERGDKCRLESGAIALLGFYGSALKVGFGSGSGWEQFGPERVITKSEGNILFELDGKSALDLYKRYLGHYANQLPASGLYFPLAISEGVSEPIVRTLLSIDEAQNSIVFAGDIPTGARATFMKSSVDRLIDGAIAAAERVEHGSNRGGDELAILISCVGRKLLFQQRIEEEVEVVQETIRGLTALTGFYSYGEIAPVSSNGRCELHNQTMTITTLREEVE